MTVTRYLHLREGELLHKRCSRTPKRYALRSQAGLSSVVHLVTCSNWGTGNRGKGTEWLSDAQRPAVGHAGPTEELLRASRRRSGHTWCPLTRGWQATPSAKCHLASKISCCYWSRKCAITLTPNRSCSAQKDLFPFLATGNKNPTQSIPQPSRKPSPGCNFISN